MKKLRWRMTRSVLLPIVVVVSSTEAFLIPPSKESKPPPHHVVDDPSNLIAAADFITQQIQVAGSIAAGLGLGLGIIGATKAATQPSWTQAAVAGSLVAVGLQVNDPPRKPSSVAIYQTAALGASVLSIGAYGMLVTDEIQREAEYEEAMRELPTDKPPEPEPSQMPAKETVAGTKTTATSTATSESIQPKVERVTKYLDQVETSVTELEEYVESVQKQIGGFRVMQEYQSAIPSWVQPGSKGPVQVVTPSHQPPVKPEQPALPTEPRGFSVAQPKLAIPEWVKDPSKAVPLNTIYVDSNTKKEEAVESKLQTGFSVDKPVVSIPPWLQPGGTNRYTPTTPPPKTNKTLSSIRNGKVSLNSITDSQASAFVQSLDDAISAGTETSLYLKDLKASANQLSSFVEAVDHARELQEKDGELKFSPRLLEMEESTAYLGQLKEAATKLSSFVDSVGTTVPTDIMKQVESKANFFVPTKSSVPSSASADTATHELAPESFMTVPRKIEKTDRYAPTKPTMKRTDAQSTGYLNQLRGAVASLSSFVEAVDDTVPEKSIEQVSQMAAPFVTVPKRLEKTDRYAPTKASIKTTNIQSSSGYLEDLRQAVTTLSSFVDAVGDAVPSQSVADKSALKVEPLVTVPRSIAKSDKYAPTKSGVKNKSSQEVGYLGSLGKTATPPSLLDRDGGVAPQTIRGDVSETPPFVTVPRRIEKSDRYAPSKPSIKTTDGRSTGYLDDLKSAVASLSSFVGSIEGSMPENLAPKPEAIPFMTVPKAIEKTDRYAPSKSSFKSTDTQSVGYLADLKSAASSLSSFVGKVSDYVASASTDETVSEVAPFVTVPRPIQKTDRYSPSRASTKNIDARSEGYLAYLKSAASSLSSFITKVEDTNVGPSVENTIADIAPFVTVPKPIAKTDRYAPSKSSIKNADGLGVGYLNDLKSAVASLSSYADKIEESVDNGSFESLPFVTVPRSIEKTDRYAPSKSSIKDSSVRSDGYLSDLQGAIASLSSFVNAVEEASSPQSALSDAASGQFTTVPRRLSKTDAYAPTKSGIKNLAVSFGGNYLGTLQSPSTLPSAGAGATIATPSTGDSTSKAEPLVTVPRRVEKTDKYAPTKSSIKSQAAKAPTSSGGYLDGIKGAVASLKSFVDVVGKAASPQQEPPVPGVPSMTTVPSRISKSDRYTPWKSTFKEIEPRQGGYLDNLKDSVRSLSSFVDKSSRIFPVDGPGDLTETQASLQTLRDDIAGVSSSVAEVQQSLSTVVSDLVELKEAIAEIRSVVISVDKREADAPVEPARWSDDSIAP